MVVALILTGLFALIIGNSAWACGTEVDC